MQTFPSNFFNGANELKKGKQKLCNPEKSRDRIEINDTQLHKKIASKKGKCFYFTHKRLKFEKNIF